MYNSIPTVVMLKTSASNREIMTLLINLKEMTFNTVCLLNIVVLKPHGLADTESKQQTVKFADIPSTGCCKGINDWMRVSRT